MVFFREMTLEYLSLNKMTPINSIVESCSILELNSMYFHSILSVQSNNFLNITNGWLFFTFFVLNLLLLLYSALNQLIKKCGTVTTDTLCLIFHDVDMIPQNYQIPYNCTKRLVA